MKSSIYENNKTWIHPERNSGIYDWLQKTMRRKTISILIGGVILGIVFFFLWKKVILVNSTKIIGELLTWKQYTEINQTTYLLFVIQYRMKEIVLFLLLTGIWNRQFASKIFLLGMGVHAGLLISIGIALYGVLGILFTLCIYFPQGMFYVIGVMLMGKNWKDTYHGSGRVENKETQRSRRYTFLVSGLFTIIGILFEVYVNLKIFFKFLKILKIL